MARLEDKNDTHSENMCPLEVCEVSLVYPNGFRALDRVNLRLETGEIIALLGASGSGKSSLLRVIEGLEPVESGRIYMGGVDVTAWPTHKRPCTMVFQDGQLFPHRTVAGNIAYGIERSGMTRAERDERVRELLEVVDLQGFERRRVTTLSGGQAQRVALARALARQTELILFDEPLSALDAPLRKSLSFDIRRIVKNAGLAAVYVTHDESEAERVADRVVCLNQGILP